MRVDGARNEESRSSKRGWEKSETGRAGKGIYWCEKKLFLAKISSNSQSLLPTSSISTSGSSVRGTLGPIQVRNIFNCFDLYISIIPPLLEHQVFFVVSTSFCPQRVRLRLSKYYYQKSSRHRRWDHPSFCSLPRGSPVFALLEVEAAVEEIELNFGEVWFGRGNEEGWPSA